MLCLCRSLEEGRVGPVSKAEIRQLCSSGAVAPSTLFWASGMPEPVPMRAVRELRWWVARGLGEAATRFAPLGPRVVGPGQTVRSSPRPVNRWRYALLHRPQAP